VQTKEFVYEANAESFDINERFQIQTCIYYVEKDKIYESKPVNIYG
jgi:hypothetical protein